jgi:UDP-N-acetylmuramoyl-L-alanyl-D-glutamate--2,6-diaminopimelate ligase
MFSKPLIDLLASLPDTVRPQAHGEENPLVTGITQDSRQVERGFLFAAIKGGAHNGETFIDAAIAQGAVVILREENAHPLPQKAGVTFLTHPHPRLLLTLLAAAFYTPMPHTRIAVTGTDGKTSTAEFIRQLWQAHGHTAMSLGTLGLRSDYPLQDMPALSDNTSPEPSRFHHVLALAAAQGVQHVVCEASSIGIEQYRMEGYAPHVAIFTSFSQDHLDYHGTMDAYFAAKARLFDTLLEADGVSICCSDYPEIATLAHHLRQQGKQVITYGAREDATLHLHRITPTAQGQDVTFSYEGKEHAVTFPIYGDFQAYNILAGLLAVSHSTHTPLPALLPLCAQLQGIKGRLERVGITKQGALIFVDYAHTAGALEKALTTLRPYASARLHLVFGCGGDRDTSKRPQMGAVAARLADTVIITDDNPRTEDAACIRAAIKTACPHATEIADRATAITTAIHQLRAGDVLLIAGKGHENYQIIGTTKHPFDDAEIAKRALC